VQRLHDHPIVVTLIALALAVAVVLVIATAWGFDAFLRAWSHPQYGWLAVVGCAELLAVGAYVVAYRGIALVHGGPRLRRGLALRVHTAHWHESGNEHTGEGAPAHAACVHG